MASSTSFWQLDLYRFHINTFACEDEYWFYCAGLYYKLIEHEEAITKVYKPLELVINRLMLYVD